MGCIKEEDGEEMGNELGYDNLSCGDSDFEPAEQSVHQTHYDKSNFEFDSEAQHLTLLGSNSPFHYSLDRKLESEHGSLPQNSTDSYYTARNNNNFDRYYAPYNY